MAAQELSLSPSSFQLKSTMITFILPWPPSINKYWRHTKNGHYISKEGINFRNEVNYKCFSYKDYFTKSERLFVKIKAYPPDKRKRDLDNILKSLLDALQHAGIYPDDNQIDKLIIERELELEGRLQIEISVL